ncbi:OCA5 [[Candida] subhashii]|uniref:OCA5 n=1 Tax=[Candida] subhashii TaxID=561895 RepID=A0A8J5UL20_9ASCO|nr:OCA5 [[Candida] subhashii]KAG7662506.1 OCA5 [[Candida] subhashii]
MTESCKSSTRSPSSSPLDSPLLSASTTTAEEFEDYDEDFGALIQKVKSRQQQQQEEEDRKPSFKYDLEIFNLCKEYLNTKNHHGLALIARQKGIPPFLRFKVWPILLKYHPFVLNPFIQPDTDIIHEASTRLSNNNNETTNNDDSNCNSNTSGSSTASTSSNPSDNESDIPSSNDPNEIIRSKIKRDLSKYIQRLKYSQSKYIISDLEREILSILENSILKFSIKWGKIIKYDSSLTWMALNLAEWFPPIPKTPWVLMGRDQQSSINNLLTINLLDDYSNYIDNIPDLKRYLEQLIYNDERISNMSFHDVYERLVLVLLHCPEPSRRRSPLVNNESEKNKNQQIQFSLESPLKVNKTTLPITGGTIEERVSYFIYCLRKVMPELSQFFHEEQILTKFGGGGGGLDDEWLIWWLKFCGSKVWSRYDRGRIWDLLLGWRLKNPKRDFNYYYEKLNYVNRNTLDKLGPDIFWSLSNEEEDEKLPNENTEDGVLKHNNSFRDLIQELNNEFHISTISGATKTASTTSSQSSAPSSSALSKGNTNPNLSIPFSRIDPHISLIFISLALLKSKENLLVELDQHEIRQLLSRLPSKSYNYKSKKKQHQHQQQQKQQQQQQQQQAEANSAPSTTPSSSLSTSPNDLSLETGGGMSNSIIISNDSSSDHKVNFIDNIIQESGELWRKWLWSEMVDDN